MQIIKKSKLTENQNQLNRGAYAIEGCCCEGQGAFRHRVNHGVFRVIVFNKKGGGEGSIKGGTHQCQPEQSLLKFRTEILPHVQSCSGRSSILRCLS